MNFRRRFPRRSLKSRSKAVVPKKKKFSFYSMQGLSVPRQVFGFPESLTTVIRYSDSLSLSGTGSAAGGNIFRLNGVFDPDYTGFGHQPLYYDQITPVYDNYVVLASTIKAEFSPITDDVEASTFGPWSVGICGNNNTTFSSTAYTLCEQNKSVNTVIGRDKGTSVKTLSMNYTPWSCLGVSASDDTVQSGVSTSPSKQFYALVWASDENGSSGVIRCRVTITYRVRFFNLKNIASS